MSRLLVVVRPALAAGFQLAGVEALPAKDAAAAQKLIDGWLKSGETGLLAVDEGLLMQFDPAFRQHLDQAHHLPYIALPSGEPLREEMSTRNLIAEMIRKAAGFHITFHGE